jgi:hypothetical protein
VGQLTEYADMQGGARRLPTDKSTGKYGARESMRVEDVLGMSLDLFRLRVRTEAEERAALECMHKAVDQVSQRHSKCCAFSRIVR